MLTGTCHCGSAQWTLEGDPGVITACNCTLCRRYGTLWAYDEDDEHGRTRISGPTTSYVRADKVVQHVFRIEEGRIRRFDIGANTG